MEVPSLPLDARLIPDYQRWVADLQLAPPNIWSYLSNHSTAGMAALFSKLFWPDLVEVEGCILLAEQYSAEEFQAWASQFQHDRDDIERMINHTHVYDLFAGHGGTRTDERVWEYLGRALPACWRCALSTVYPSRAFAFDYGSEPEDYGPTISFWQVDR